MKLLTSEYNKRQDEYFAEITKGCGGRIVFIEDVTPTDNKDDCSIEFNNKFYILNCFYNIGFYEWLFNPRYKVFEVFDITYIKTSMLYELEGAREKIIIRQPEEIIKYLESTIKRGKE